MLKKFLCLFVAAGWILTVGSHAKAATLSLDPFSAYLDGAEISPSGFNGSLRLPGNDARPGFALGFTLPGNYVPNSTVKVVLLWDTREQNCTFGLAPNFLYVAGQGQPLKQSGGASAGLSPLKASTPYTIHYSVAQEIAMSAPEPGNTTEQVIFTIKPEAASGLPRLRPGYAVNFGIFRAGDSQYNTCSGDLNIAGISVVYQAR